MAAAREHIQRNACPFPSTDHTMWWKGRPTPITFGGRSERSLAILDTRAA